MKLDTSNRLINQVFENPAFLIDEESLGYLVRDIINMNWWNTSGVLLGYRKNKRISAPFNETQKRIAVQLKEYYRIRRIRLKNEEKFRQELRGYIGGTGSKLEQLNMYSMAARANPSQFFTRKNGEMTWVDCTSRATYAAKYVYQNGFIDFDGKCRVLGASQISKLIDTGECENLGVGEFFIDGDNTVKSEVFSQKNEQQTVLEWVDHLKINPITKRVWILDAIGHVRTDPYKNYEAGLVSRGLAKGVNERLYGFSTSATLDASSASRASSASDASRASSASDASHASRASDASHASHASSASSASSASNASDAGTTSFIGGAWAECKTAITKPDHLNYPGVFRKNIFAIAGNWKINPDVASLAKLGWFDPFSGHGTSPLYAKRHGIRYLGFDTNKRAFDEYLSIVRDECYNSAGSEVEIVCADSTVFRPEMQCKFDLCYTSPPYFNFEEYGGNTGHLAGCETYDDFHENITRPVFQNVMRYLIPGGTLALQTEKDKKAKKAWEDVISSLGFRLVSSGLTGQEAEKYSTLSKRDQTLLIFSRD